MQEQTIPLVLAATGKEKPENLVQLFATFLRTLETLPDNELDSIAQQLEHDTGGRIDDLPRKLRILVKHPLPPRDKVYCLWLFYVTFFHSAVPLSNIYIGPDIVGDEEEALRIISWTLPKGFADTLLADLTTLADEYVPQSTVEYARTGNDSVKFTLHESR